MQKKRKIYKSFASSISTNLFKTKNSEKQSKSVKIFLFSILNEKN